MQIQEIATNYLTGADQKYALGKYGDEFSIILMCENGYVNATKLIYETTPCNRKAKDLKYWFKTRKSRELIFEIEFGSNITAAISVDPAVYNFYDVGGIYVHPLLLPHIMSWALPKFAIKVSKIVNEFFIKERRGLDNIDELTKTINDQNKKIEEQVNKIRKQDEQILYQNDQIQKFLDCGNMAKKQIKIQSNQIRALINQKNAQNKHIQELLNRERNIIQEQIQIQSMQIRDQSVRIQNLLDFNKRFSKNNNEYVKIEDQSAYKSHTEDENFDDAHEQLDIISVYLEDTGSPSE